MATFFIILFCISIISFYIFIMFFINKIEKYEKLEIECVLDNKTLKEKYNIDWQTNPKDYGFNYFDCYYASLKDNLKLHGWYIPSINKDSQKTIIFCHGRNANKLIILEYLEIIKNSNLNDEYSIFIPDLRNSGKSQSARTYMGYKFADDIYYTMQFLRNNYFKNSFILYGFSMGAMGVSIFLEKYNSVIKSQDMKIEKIILDSPLSNVYEILKNNYESQKVPKQIWNIVSYFFNIRVDSKLYDMYLDKLLYNKNIKTLVLQSLNDPVTPYNILEKSTRKLRTTSFYKFKLFESAYHVMLYREYKEEYSKIVTNFIKN